MKPWYGVDLDGTLAYYDKWEGPDTIGAPIPLMIERVKKLIAEGKDVRIFTARVYPIGIEHTTEYSTVDENFREFIERKREARKAKEAIERWCLQHLGTVLACTCFKDYGMIELYDDRAVQIVPNTGLRADGKDNEQHELFNTRSN